MSNHGQRHDLIERFLRSERWVDGPFTVAFLAAGEYNENYRVETNAGRFVFRINHGTQLQLDDQIAYEYTVLGIVASSGVTPKPFRLCRRHRDFPRGALLMDYLPGRHLDYEHDLPGAAECFARIHTVPYDAGSGSLLVQASPVDDIVAECRELLARHPDHPLPEQGDAIARYMERVVELAGSASFGDEELCVVNTEVNSGNFLVQDGPDRHRVRLVDWEKAVASYRYQDLGHFLVPTTTLWKTDYRFDPATRRRFLELYRDAAGLSEPLDAIDERTELLERTILLRAFSWVYMAWAEYTSGTRPITNEDTFATMRSYLENIDQLLDVG